MLDSSKHSPTYREAFLISELQNVEMGKQYVNVYVDNKGVTHYSTEEFAIGQNGIYSFYDAIDEARLLTAKWGWEYVTTLVPNSYYRDSMEIKLERLQLARKVILEFGGQPDSLPWDELEDTAKDLLDGDRI